MKYSFEVPIAYLKAFDKVNDYHFILAHMLLKDKDYAKFYKQSKKFKILDNGCAELGKSISVGDLVRLANEYNVDVLVLPDIWMDGTKTFKESIRAYHLIKKSNPVLFDKLKFMFVIQGNSSTDFANCYSKFESEMYIRTRNVHSKIIYGLPYMTCAKILSPLSPHKRDDDVTNARIRIIQSCLFMDGDGHDYEVHLLGAGFNFSQELSFMRHYPQIKTADTSTPFVLAQNNIKLDKYGQFNRVIGKAGTLDFYEKFDKKKLRLAIHNAKVLKRFGRV